MCKPAGCDLINVQVDASYDLASSDEVERQRSLATVRRWIEAAALLRSRAVRINPGRAGGSIEKSIASMKQVNEYCVSHRLPLLTENHFGLEMNPDVHLQIREAAGPKNIYTLPDFGNYPVETMWDSLAKILPYAYVVSAKAVDFNDQAEQPHTTSIAACNCASARASRASTWWSNGAAGSRTSTTKRSPTGCCSACARISDGLQYSPAR